MTSSDPMQPARQSWRDLNGKLIRRPGRLAITVAAYGNHLHTEAGGRPDLGSCLNSLMDFRQQSVKRWRLRSKHSSTLLWLIDLVGGSMPLEELRIATEQATEFDLIIASMTLDRLVAVTDGAAVLTERGKHLAEVSLQGL